MPIIYGKTIDSQGRCAHYATFFDVIANKCYLCKRYYACYRCHDESHTHSFVPWPLPSEAKIVCCGNCEFEMTGQDYLSTPNCKSCNHSFNKNCAKHRHLYFSF